jgi:hypothetical protein
MPLFPEAICLIRKQLHQIEAGERVKAVVVGTLTTEQLSAINNERQKENHPPVVAEVLFLGKHIYQSRVARDGYSIEDVIDQIVSAMSDTAVVSASPRMTCMQSIDYRADRYGNRVRDVAVFECTARHPRPEPYSVVPKGDLIKPKGHC